MICLLLLFSDQSPKWIAKAVFFVFFLIHTLFRKVEWEESIIEGYEESRGAFPPFPSYSESDARNCSNNENEVNRVNRAEAAYVQHLFLFSILPTQRRRRRTNEAREPARAITVGFGTTVTRLATPLNRLRQDSLYRQFLVGQTPVNTTEPRYVLYVYYILKIHGVFEVHTTKIHFFFKYYKYCKDKWTLIL